MYIKISKGNVIFRKKNMSWHNEKSKVSSFLNQKENIYNVSCILSSVSLSDQCKIEISFCFQLEWGLCFVLGLYYLTFVVKNCAFQVQISQLVFLIFFLFIQASICQIIVSAGADPAIFPKQLKRMGLFFKLLYASFSWKIFCSY